MITKKDIGKRIIVNGESVSTVFNNERGKIIRVEDDCIGIEFDKKHKDFHSLDDKGKSDRCYWISLSHENIIKFEKRRNTGIKIATEKVVGSDGELKRKIVSAKLLSHNKLPDAYLNGTKPVVFLRYITGSIFCLNNSALEREYRIGSTYTEKEFNALKDHCYAAGDHLMQVNKDLAKKKAEWTGTETFII